MRLIFVRPDDTRVERVAKRTPRVNEIVDVEGELFTIESISEMYSPDHGEIVALIELREPKGKPAN